MIPTITILLLILCWVTPSAHAQPHPRLTIQRQRVVQSCGAVLDATQSPGSYLMSATAGLTSIGITQSDSRSRAYFGFWVQRPIILSIDTEPGTVIAGERTWSWPNPFRDNVQIEVQLSGATASGADVFDNIGQFVASLPVSSLRDDAAVFVWNGICEGGLPCSSGTYTVRINVTEPIHQRRIVYSTTISRVR